MKNKKFLIGFIAASLAVTSFSVIATVYAKKADVYSNMKQAVAEHDFNVDMTTIQSTGDTGVYQAVAVGSGENKVTAKLVGVTPTEGGFTVAANSIAYITNMDSIRGIASLKLNYTGGSPIIMCYGSANLLNVDDIFGGKYQDLAVTQRNSWEEGFNFTLGPSQNENSFANCHYVLGFIYNLGDKVLTFDKVNFTAVCGDEPDTPEIGTYSDFTAVEKAKFVTNNVPSDFPFPACGSYYLEFGAGEFQVAMNCLVKMANYGTMINAIQSSGYNVNVPAIGPIVNEEEHYTGIGVQRKRGDIVDTLLLTINDPVGGYVYIQVAYTDQMGEMSGNSEWPTDDINSRFPGMANYFVPLQLTNASYSIMMSNESYGRRHIYMYITVDNFANASTELDAYLAGLDTNVYTVDGYEVSHVDGLHKMSIYGQESANMFSVELLELVIYNTFPFDQLDNYTSSEPVFPKESSIDEVPGKYTVDFDDVTAKEFDSSDLESLVSILEAKGYYRLGNTTSGVIKPRINSDMEYYGYLRYSKINSTTYLFESNKYDIDDDNDSLVGAYQRTGDYEAYSLFGQVLDYSGKFSIVRDGNIFVITLVGGTYADFEAMYAAIDTSKVAYKEMFSSRHSFSFAVETEYSSPGDEAYENFDLFFTETSTGLDIEIIAENYHTGSPTFDHDSVGAYANQTNALSEIETGAYGSPLAVPTGNNYIIGPTNSIQYVATAEETRNLANSYATTLLNYGYHYEPSSRIFISPNEDHPNVRIMEDHCPGRLTIEFTHMEAVSPLVNYSDLDSDSKAFLANFPTLNVEGGKYASIISGNQLTLYFNNSVVPLAYLTTLSQGEFASEYPGSNPVAPYSTLIKIDDNFNYYEVSYNHEPHDIFSFEYGFDRIIFEYEAERFKPVDSTYFNDKFYDYVILPQSGRIAIEQSKYEPSAKSNSFLIADGNADFVTYLLSQGFVKQENQERYVKTETIDDVKYYTAVNLEVRSLYTRYVFDHGVDSGGKE